MTPDQIRAIQALREVARLFVQTVKEMGPLGAPSGPMYAAVMGQMTLSQYQQVMGGLVRKGYLRQEGDVYYHVKDL